MSWDWAILQSVCNEFWIILEVLITSVSHIIFLPVFRARFTSRYKNLQVQQFFKPRHIEGVGSNRRLTISTRRCSKGAFGRKMMLFGANKSHKRVVHSGDLNIRIGSVTVWKNSYQRVIRRQVRNMQRYCYEGDTGSLWSYYNTMKYNSRKFIATQRN